MARTTLDALSAAVPDPRMLNESLNSLTFHDSPPPTLSSRMADVAEPIGANGRQEGDDDAGRRLPPVDSDPEGAITSFIENLLNPDHADTQPHLLAIGYELEALVSIYSPSAVRLSTASRPPSWIPDQPLLPPPLPGSREAEDAAAGSGLSGEPRKRDSQAWTDALKEFNLGLSPTERIRYEVTIPAWEVGESLEGVDEADVPPTPPDLRVLVSLPPTYPNSSPPQLQLLGRYLGSFPIDAGLFGDITRTYISSSGVAFVPGDVCVFEGLTHVQSLARAWYADNLSAELAGQKAREADRKQAGSHGAQTPTLSSDDHHPVRPSPSRANFSYSRTKEQEQDDSSTPQTVKDAQRDVTPTFHIVSSEPITERRSTFVGHAVRVTDEREVPLVVYQLLEDKKIAKAHHPTIFAYRIVKDVGGAAGKVLNSDHDDDGETQAGARLKHLLEILELENVLVVVTRWYGGTLLGADRFKYINQVARDALELGGFLEERERGTGGAGKGKGKKK